MLAGCVPWPEDFARRYRAEGYWQGITLSTMLERSVAQRPDKVALSMGERRVTYTELLAGSDRLAVRLAALGLKPLDRVVFQLDAGIAFFQAFFALLRLGVIPVMALPAHRETEIRHFAKHAGAVGYFIPERHRDFDFRAMAEAVRAEVPGLKTIIVDGAPLPGQHGLGELNAAGASDAEVAAMRKAAPNDPSEVALMLLSGGTTAISKLIPRTHDDYVYNCTHCGKVLEFGPEVVFLSILPLAHNFTLGSPGVLAALAHGGRVVMAPDTRPETVFPLIEREKATVMGAAVPLVVNWLATDWPERCDHSSLRIFMNGGAKLVPELRRQAEARFGGTYVESFGTGEGLLNKTRLGDGEDLRFNSSGRPISPGDEIKIVDENDNEVPDGTPGELLVRGPYTIRGYYNAPEANASAFTADGFYRMGDVVKRVDGYLYVEGRRKDLINRGGEKISCEEVENHIIAHPAVKSVCVVAMPDPTFGEKGCAFVIPKPGQDLTLDQLKAFLATRAIAKFKWPERVEIADSFPISPAGKILRRDLRAIIAAKIEAERAG